MSRKAKQRAAASAALSPLSWLWGLLFLHLGISPVFFHHATIEPFDYPKSLLLQLTAGILLGASIAGGPRRPLVAARLRDPVSIGVVLFTASAILSTLFSISPLMSMAGAPESFAGLPTLLALVVVFFAVRAACPTWIDARRLLIAPVIGAAVTAAYALVQSTGVDVFSWSRVAEFGGVRPFGTMGNANALGSFLAAVLPIAIYLAVLAQRRGQRALATAYGVTIVLCSFAIVRSASRAAWLGLLVGVVVILLVLVLAGERKAAKRIGLISGVWMVAALVVMAVTPWGREFAGVLWSRVSGAAGIESRLFIWSAAIDIFRAHPILGAGVDTFGLAFSPLRTPEFWAIEWNTTFVRAHNEALHILATQGAFGAGALLVIAFGVIRSAWTAWRSADSEQRLFIGATLAAIGALLPQMSLGLLQTAPAVLLTTLAAFLSREPDEPADRTPLPGAVFGRTALVVAALAPLILLMNMAAWQTGSLNAVICTAAFCAPLVAVLLIRRRDDGEADQPTLREAGDKPGPWKAGATIAAMAALAFLYSPVSANIAAARGIRLAASDPDAPVRSHERATELHPSHAPHWLRFGEALQAAASRAGESGGAAERRRAREAFERAGSLEPLDGRSRMFLCRAIAAQALAGETQAETAFAACDRAIEIEPANPYFHTAATNAAVQLRDLPRARGLADRGLALFPRFGAILYQAGFIALQQGRLDDAIRLLTAASEGDWHGQEAGRESARAALSVAVARRTPS